MKGSTNINKNENLGINSGTNFRTSSKDPGQSTNNLGATLPKKKEDGLEKVNMMHSQIHVKKWVDYSTKYGLGYLLSDGSTGVYFNDSTKIILDRNNETFEYIEKKAGEKIDTISRYTLNEYPQ